MMMTQSSPEPLTVRVAVVVERVKLFNATLVAIEASAIIDQPTLLTAKEACTVVVRDRDQIQMLRRVFSGDRPPGPDMRTLGWISCGPRQNKNGAKGKNCTTTAETPEESHRSTILSCRVLVTTAIERNRRGRKMLECFEVLEIQRDVDEDELLELVEIATKQWNNGVGDQQEQQQQLSSIRILHDKKIRHHLFATWLVETFGRTRLATGTGVLDVAGGKGELGEVFRDDYNIPSILLDPLPRCDMESPPFSIIERPLEGDGSLIMGENATIAQLMENCSIITGMHPDQATEAIVDTALRLGKPFAILPCCVMPKLFPHRMQKRHNQPVRSHSTFCQYLLDKAPAGCTFQVHHLPFDGRNKVIYFDFQCTFAIP